jgi:hypothetical protein
MTTNAWQQLDKHVYPATYAHVIIELFETVFSMQCMPQLYNEESGGISIVRSRYLAMTSDL